MAHTTHPFIMKPKRDSPPVDETTLVKIPAGTILFHAFRLEEGDPRHSGFFKAMLGFPTTTGYCLSPAFNVYTFPFPYVSFGILDYKTQRPMWETFNAFTDANSFRLRETSFAMICLVSK